MAKKKKKWIKFRHKIIVNLASLILIPITKIKYRVKVARFKESKRKDRKYLVLYNHQTAFDQFFVSMAFYGHVYYVASEDLFSMGFLSKLLKYAVAPIPIKKQTTDVTAVMNCLRVAKEGGTIAISPEGNRTFSGKTCYFKPAVVKLAKALKMPIAIFRIEDGYGVHPRWADDVRRGDMKAYVKRVIEPDEYLKMTDDQLYGTLKEELYVDESSPNKEFYHKRLAEGIERAIYYCPDCGISQFDSKGDLVWCEKCGKKIRYTPNKQLIGVDFDFKYKNIADWYDSQATYMNGLNLNEFTDKPISTDNVKMSKVILYKNKVTIDKNAELKLFGNRITAKVKGAEYVFDFDKTDAVTVLGKNKINVYYNNEVYQFSDNKKVNALKYVNTFNRYINAKGGNEDDFLGL
ncbi:MAG: 1-acyl-sn-glycerol-3-phosphate acyltransferase [Clostridiales bacterium]|nr:1-acyl-sn-glycerol-3-phosphate acyltransferase [Clostridiales bacterium]